MKRVMRALVIACLGAAGSVTLSGQKGLPSCDADNGGLTLPAGLLRACRARRRHRRRPSHRRQRQRRHLRDSASWPAPHARGRRSDPGASSDCATRTATARPTWSARSSATVGGTGLELRNGYLYYAAVDAYRPLQADARRAEAVGARGDRRRRIPGRRRPRGEGHRVRQCRQRVHQHRPAVECVSDSRSASQVRPASIRARSSTIAAASGDSRPTSSGRSTRRKRGLPAACANRSRSRGTTDTCTWR